MHLLAVAFDGRGLSYLADLLLPLALLPLAAPLLALVALPELALNLLSATPTQTSIHFHYTAGAIAAAGGRARSLGAGRLVAPRGSAPRLAAGRGRRRARRELPPRRRFRSGGPCPGGSELQSRAARVSAHDRVAARALALVPPARSSPRRTRSAPTSRRAGASSASRTLAGRDLGRRRRAQPGYADRLAPLPYATQLSWLRRNPAGSSSSSRTASSSSAAASSREPYAQSGIVCAQRGTRRSRTRARATARARRPRRRRAAPSRPRTRRPGTAPRAGAAPSRARAARGRAAPRGAATRTRARTAPTSAPSATCTGRRAARAGAGARTRLPAAFLRERREHSSQSSRSATSRRRATTTAVTAKPRCATRRPVARASSARSGRAAAAPT